MNAFSNNFSPALQRLGEVSVRLSVELGRTDMPLRDVLALAEGSVVSLDRLTDELLDITANGQVIAHGEVIAQDGKFALRIVSLAGGEGTGSSGPSAPAPSGPKADAPVSAAQEPEAPAGDAPGVDAPASDDAPAPETASEEEPPAQEPAGEESDPLLDALDELADDDAAPQEDDSV